MDSKIKTQITNSGDLRLKKLLEETRENVINKIKSAKYAPGDDFIEITASDVEKIASRIKIIQPQKSHLKQLLIISYTVMGVLLTIIGIYYDDFRSLLTGDPTRLMLITMGVFLILFSVVASFYIKQKQNQEKDLINAEIEKRKITDMYSIIQSGEKETEIASTQYNDLKGTAALDFHGSLSEMWGIFEKYGLNVEEYEPFGLSIYYGETDFFNLSLLAIDKKNNIVSNSLKNSKTPVVSIGLDISKQEFERLYKRFHILLSNKDKAKNFEIINELSIDDLNKL